MKKITIILATFVFIFVLVSSAVALDKVDVCHVRGNGEYNVITISVSALPAHLAHGDALYVDGVCQWSATATPTATFTPSPTPTPTVTQEPPPPVIVIAGYYMPIIYQFFDWDEYCFPRCPLGIDQNGNRINAYP